MAKVKKVDARPTPTLPDLPGSDVPMWQWFEYQLHCMTKCDECMGLVRSGAPFPFLNMVQQEMAAWGVPQIRPYAMQDSLTDNVWAYCFPDMMINPNLAIGRPFVQNASVGNLYGQIDWFINRYRYASERDTNGYQKRSFFCGVEAMVWRHTFTNTEHFKHILGCLDWRTRQAVLYTPDYNGRPRHRLPPWHRSHGIPSGHFTHLHPETAESVRFFPNAEKGELGRWTVMKAGRYLKQFYDYLDDAEIKKIVENLRDGGTLCFAKTPKEIVDLYLTGPRSCMAHPNDEYESGEYGFHPVEVYGNSPDLAVAYVAENGAPNGRCICWPDRKLYGRVYGHQGGEHTVKNLLEAKGFKYGSMQGARIRKISVDKQGRVVMPYVDNVDCAYELKSDGGLYLRLGHPDSKVNPSDLLRGRWHTQFTCGISRDGGSICYECGTYDTDIVEQHGRLLCTSCQANMYRCQRSGGYYNRNQYPSVEVVVTLDNLGQPTARQTWANFNAARYAFHDDYLDCMVSTGIGRRNVWVLDGHSFVLQVWNMTHAANCAVRASDGEFVATDDLGAYEARALQFAKKHKQEASDILAGRM